jgi:heme-degrading monooxygenase HmoA
VIARIWRGTTRATDADEYLEFLRGVDFGYPAQPGYLGVLALRAVGESEAEFVLVTLWDSEEAIAAFAGNDIARAVFFPEDDRFLVERGSQVHHFDVVAEPFVRSKQ